MSDFQHAEDAIQWIHSLIPRGIKPGLRRMEWLMDRLDHPERRLKFIHIAGTNGKGSTASYLAHVLREANYDVGLFTSPFLETFTDRIRYNGENISDEDLVSICNVLKPLVEACEQTELGSPTEFEVITAVAIYYYAKVSFPYFVVWETGLGGRWDSTNIVTPLVSVITNIGYDHMNILGDSISDIASEKAGIIKPGVPVVTAAAQPEALEVISRKANEMRSALYIYGRDFTTEGIQITTEGQIFSYGDAFSHIENIEISLKGPHQIDNAAVSIMALSVLKQYYAAIIDEDELKRGMKNTAWPGRFEQVGSDPIAILDGAHNAEGAQVLRKTLETVYPGKKIHLMLGLLVDKSVEAFLKEVMPLAATVTITEPDSHRAMKAEELAQVAKAVDANKMVYTEPNWKVGIKKVQSLAAIEDVIVYTGSLYLISDIRNFIFQK